MNSFVINLLYYCNMDVKIYVRSFYVAYMRFSKMAKKININYLIDK